MISNNSSESPHSGSWDAWLDGYGTTHTDTLSQAVTLPTGCSNYNFSFWLHIDTAETTTTTKYDTLKVQILNSSGTVLSTLHTYSNLDHNTGYAQRSFSLSAYAGQKITLKFTGAEDYELTVTPPAARVLAEGLPEAVATAVIEFLTARYGDFVLLKPADFDPKKKYPMMVYIYERLKQNMNRFVNPAPGTA